MLRDLFVFVFLLAGCFCIAGLGAIATSRGIRSGWYGSLSRPAWNPPDWVFGPVWTILYATMAVAAWLVWKNGGFERNTIPFAFFLAQLLLNGLWSWLFFHYHSPGWALLDLAALWLMILATAWCFWLTFRPPDLRLEI